jgi:hypothetical protein
MVTAAINKRISIAETDKYTVIKHTYDKAIVSHKHSFRYDLNEMSKYSSGDPLDATHTKGQWGGGGSKPSHVAAK